MKNKNVHSIKLVMRETPIESQLFLEAAFREGTTAVEANGYMTSLEDQVKAIVADRPWVVSCELSPFTLTGTVALVITEDMLRQTEDMLRRATQIMEMVFENQL